METAPEVTPGDDRAKLEPLAGDEGYQPALSNRQVQMIAIGGAIGVGLFYGTGEKIATAGPGLVLSFLVAGVVAFFVLRAMGELVLYRPTAGSFVEYSRQFIGPWAGYVSGWMYWLNWAATGVAEITAIGVYVKYWAPAIPQWLSALGALALLLAVNLLSVRLFGELEFWFATLKVLAIVSFLVTGIGLILAASGIGDAHASVANLTSHGGLFPKGFPIVLMSLQAVVFAYAGTEMVGVAAGETKDPRRVIPRAVNGVIWRIAVFYCGSVLLLVMVLPWTDYSANQSPFVTVFAKLGVPGAASIMNAVILTAALSATNSGLYSTGRILRSLAARGEAPKITGRMNKHHVPYGGIMLTCTFYFLGVILNIFVPRRAFDIATSLASLGVLATWVSILVCQMRLRAAASRGELPRPAFRLPGSPVTNVVGLAMLALVLGLMPFASSEQAIAFACLPVLILALWYGWYRIRRNRDPRRIVPAARPSGD
ncbi:MAG TPA: amino acid permease [Streptosporangiaceae bacterium]|nr:amino acid permease [Streptosporangiaceae bacterium]